MEAELFDLTEPPEDFQEVRHGFEVASNHLLVPRDLYSELISRPRICRIPTTPIWFSGFINHRGETVPIFDLAALIGEGETDTGEKPKRWVLLLDEQPYMVGILLSEPPAALVAPTPLDETAAKHLSEALRAHTHGYVEHKGRVWAELNHRQFFAAVKERFS
ncbi:chemotaxis protein CheW [Pontibacterium granulatum]|uniref:chemotaxis protein CheW n=1 Tax=Pontibacterium granulatum TaxID=2036029 RepID=UPI00249CB555|nr:chemotaxis protein CheW [Pontibacterium granulatum]MDI3325323.1 chemotaxis protein CheW [Pontibacterium granulatum]